MIFLIDTNIFIPLEPTALSDQEAITKAASQLHQDIIASGHQIFMHSASKEDIARDRNSTRRRLRELSFEKYPLLPDPPSIPTSTEEQFGKASRGSHDWVDHLLLAAIFANAADFLVTEDKEIRAKAARMHLAERIFSVSEALTLIRDLSEEPPLPPPAVHAVKAHRIQASDPILDSLRADYSPNFDAWLTKCQRGHRQAWVIEGEGPNLAAFCIINPETNPPYGLSGRVLKLCSFKVGDAYNGLRYGELLLKTVFEHAFGNKYDWIYVTVFEGHDRLIELFETFGFSRLPERAESGELVLTKPLTPGPQNASMDPLQFNIRYGPRNFRIDGDWFAVPLRPHYSDLLFPETVEQSELFTGQHSFGNALRKAYLCHSKIRALSPGDGLIFYRSRVRQGVVAVGVVEDTIRSSSPEIIARAVAKRTVYSFREIQRMCEKSVLAVLFRQARVFHPAIRRSELIEAAVFAHSPQSIITLGGEGLSWLRKRIVE